MALPHRALNMAKKKLKNKKKCGRSPSKKGKDSKVKKLIKLSKQKAAPKSKRKGPSSKKPRKNN